MVDASSSTALPGDTAGACFAAAIYCRLGERRERFEPGLRPGRPHVGSLFDCLAPSPTIQWLNPRTGQKSPAVAVVGTTTCQLPTPDQGDWVLVMKSGK